MKLKFCLNLFFSSMDCFKYNNQLERVKKWTNNGYLTEINIKNILKSIKHDVFYKFWCDIFCSIFSLLFSSLLTSSHVFCDFFLLSISCLVLSFFCSTWRVEMKNSNDVHHEQPTPIL